jgi:ferredoxin-NADP reductase
MHKAQEQMSAQILALRDVTPTVREFLLQLPQVIPAWQPGSHIRVYLNELTAPDAARSKRLTRHYSLLPTEQNDQLRIAVKRVEPSRGGSQAMWSLRVGQSLLISEPINQFPLDLSAPDYLLIAGGIGITPLVSMAEQLMQRGARLRMLYAARNPQEWAYKAQLQTLLGDRIQFLAGAAPEGAALLEGLSAQGQAYVCGPSGLLSAVQQAWANAGRSASSLRFETFGASSASAEAFEVAFPRHRLSFTVQPGLSLLDAIEEQGVSAMWGCRKGECGLCALPVLALEGEIEHRDVFFSEHEKRSNAQICPCVSRVRGKITLDSAFRPDSFNSAISASAHS